MLLRQSLIRNFYSQSLTQKHQRIVAGGSGHESVYFQNVFCWRFIFLQLKGQNLVCFQTFIISTIHCCISTPLVRSLQNGSTLFFRIYHPLFAILSTLLLLFLSRSLLLRQRVLLQTHTDENRGFNDGSGIPCFATVRSWLTHVGFGMVAIQLSSDYVRRLFYGTTLTSDTSVNGILIRTTRIYSDSEHARIPFF